MKKLTGGKKKKPEEEKKVIKRGETSEEDEEDEDYDDEEDEDEEDYDVEFEDNEDAEIMPVMSLVRSETKEISPDYSYKKLLPSEVLESLLNKINSLKDIYSYANIDPTIYFTTLRKNHYILNETSSALEEKILNLMETRGLKELDFSEGPLNCNLCFFEIENPEEGADFGCGHVFCLECMREYVNVKIDEGPFCIFSNCPYDGCNFIMGLSVVEKVCDDKHKDM